MSLPPAHAHVVDHRPCRRCGYDLIGLAADGACPECGDPIQGEGTRFADNLTDAPLHYLRRLTLALWILAASILVAVTTRVMAAFGVFSLGVLRPAYAEGAVVAATAAWALAVWLATTKRRRAQHTPPDPLLDSPKLRLAVRLTQSAAPLAAIAAVASGYVAPVYAVALLTTTAVLGVTAFLGASALCAYLSALADWAGDTGVAERFRASAWGIAVLGLATLGSVLLSPVVPSLLVVGAWTSVLLLLVVLLFVYAIFEIVRLTSWAVSNHITALDRDARVAQMRRRQSEELADRVSRLDDAVPYEAAVSPQQPPAPEESVPIAGADDDIDRQLDAINAGDAAPARPRPSKIRHPRQTFPPVGRHPSAHDAPPAPRPPSADSGEAHYEEHRIEPRRRRDP